MEKRTLRTEFEEEKSKLEIELREKLDLSKAGDDGDEAQEVLEMYAQLLPKITAERDHYAKLAGITISSEQN